MNPTSSQLPVIKGMKKTVALCELCGSSVAMAHCESDTARLCWECDGKVHGANFLVARHSRVLLCHLCQSPTPWRASGPNLPGVAMSLCLSCTCHLSHATQQDHPEELSDFDHHHDDDEEEENQVVT